MRTAAVLLFLLLMAASSHASNLLTVEDIVEAAYLRDSIQRSEINDLMVSAESFARKLSGDGKVKEEKKFTKTYYFKDTLFKAEFHEYYKKGEKQNDKDLQKEIEEARKRREKGRIRDASIRPLLPFCPDLRSNYEFELHGTETRQDYRCYRVEARSKVEAEDQLEGEFWIEMENYNLVYAEFHPAKMPGPIKQLDMQMSYAPTVDGYWLMERFHLYGRGKVMIFIKFYFEVEEFYSDYRINTGLSENIFKEVSDED